MKVRQHLRSFALLTLVLRALGVSFFSIVSVLIVDGSGGGPIGVSCTGRRESLRDVLAAQDACKALPETNHSAL